MTVLRPFAPRWSTGRRPLSTVRRPFVDPPSTDRRPIVARSSINRRPTFDRPSNGRRPIVAQSPFDLRPVVAQSSTARRSPVHRPSSVRRPSVGRSSAVRRPTASLGYSLLRGLSVAPSPICPVPGCRGAGRYRPPAVSPPGSRRRCKRSLAISSAFGAPCVVHTHTHTQGP